MKKSSAASRHHLGTLAALLLFGVFAVCVLMVLFTGTGVYKRMLSRSSGNYYYRTCSRYLITRVRQGTAVTLEKLRTGDALALHEEIDGTEYVTYVYCSGGFLRELFTQAGYEPSAESGEEVLEAEGLSLELADGLLKAEVTPPGSAAPVRLLLDVKEKGDGL